jgi:AhpD family alkylhydroperoxidase
VAKIPQRFMKFKEDYPKIAEAYERLGSAVHTEGPLDEKTRALVKLAISAGSGLEGAVHSHTRKALEQGITKKEIRQVILLMLPTVGLPKMMAALSWVEDILEKN